VYFGGGFPLLPALPVRVSPLKKKLRKKFRKNLEVNQKSPYLCSRFPGETEATEEAIFDEFT